MFRSLPFLLAFLVFSFSAHAATQSETFDAETNYSFDGTKVEIAGGAAQLKNNGLLLIDQDNTQAEFDAGSYTAASWQTDKVALSTDPSLVSTRGLIAYWNFNESSGTNSADVIGGFDGTHQSTPAILTGQTNFGNALDFVPASLEYVDIGDHDAFSFGDGAGDRAFSVAAWVNMDDATNFQVMGKWSGTTDREWYFHVSNSDLLTFAFWDESADALMGRIYNVGMTGDEGSWIHLAATYDGSGSPSGVDIYRNGIAVDNADQITGSYTAMENLTASFGLGHFTNYADGTIDDVLIFNRELSAVEVAAIAAGAGEFDVSKPLVMNTLSTLSSGLVGYWDFESGTGQTVTDQMATQNGTLGPTSGAESQDPTWNDAAKGGTSGLTFDGTDDFVNIADHASLDFSDTADFTLAGWFYRNDATTDDVLIAKRNGIAAGDQGYIVYLDDADDKLYFEASDGSNEYQLASTSAFTELGWHHFALTWDQSSAAVLYIDGVNDNAAATGILTNVGALSTALDLRIGAESDGENLFSGLMDEIGIWSRALPAHEVASLLRTRGMLQSAAVDAAHTSPTWAGVRVQKSKPYGEPLQKPPVAYWKFEAGSGTTLDNMEGTAALDGTLTVGAGGAITTTAGSWNSGMPNAVFSNTYTLDFDGTDDYVSVADNSILDFGDTADMTLVGWFNRDTFSNTHVLAAKTNGIASSDTGYIVYIDGSDDKLYFEVADGTNEYREVSVTTFTTAGWNHFAVVWDESDAVATEIFINGVAENAVATGTIGNVGDLSNTRVFRIGAESDGANYFDGKIDEVAVFDYALTPAQVAGIASGAKTPRVQTDNYEKNLTAHYRLENDGADNAGANAGTLAADASFTAGVRGAALSLDGTGDWLDIADDAALDFGNTSDMTLTGWFLRDTNTTDDVLIAKRNGIAAGDSGYILYVDDANDTLIFEVSDGSNEYQLESKTTFLTAAWNHFAIVWDQDSAANTEIYINGAADEAGDTGTISSVGDLSNALALRLGAESDGGNEHAGDLDEIALFNAALTAAQVKEVYERDAATLRLQARTDDNSGMSSATAWSGAGISDKSPGLVAVWHLSGGTSGGINEGVTAGFEDALGTHNGTARNLINSGMAWTQGLIFGAVDLDGTDDYIEIADHNDFSFGDGASADTAFSVVAWVNMDDALRFPIITKATNTTCEWYFNTDSSYKINFTLCDLNTSNKMHRYFNTAVTADENSWVHFAATYDGSESNSGMKIYRNGIRVDDTSATSGTYAAMHNSTEKVSIGRISGLWYADGSIDDVGLWKRELSGAEIMALVQGSHGLTLSADQADFYGIADEQYMQYRVLWESVHDHAAADLQSLSLIATGFYPLDNPTVQLSAGTTFSNLTGFTETVVKPGGSDIKYQLSPNGGTTWYYNPTGSAWTTSDGTYAQSSTSTQINGDISEFDDDAALTAAGSYKFRAFLNSDGTVTPQLQNLDTVYESGSITVAAPNGSESWAVAAVQYITWTPTGTVPDDLTLEYNTINNEGIFANLIASGEGNHHNEEDMSGIVAVWHLGEGSGTAVDNAEGTAALDGTLTVGGAGSITDGTGNSSWPTAQFGKGLEFDGTDDYVNVADNAALDVGDTADLSISGWFNRDTFASDHVILAKADGITSADTGYIVYIDDADDKLYFEIADGTDEYQLASASTFTTTGWNHFVIVWDQDSAANSEIYINGSDDDAVDTGTIGNLGDLSNALALRLGSESDSANYFDGMIDEVAVFNKVLSAAEIVFLASANAGYPWTIPNDVTSNGRVHVRSASVPAIRDYSDAKFSITPALGITIVSPAGSEVWVAGSTHSISWSTAGSVPNDIVLEYTLNGSSWVVIGDTLNTPLNSTTGTPYTWQLPDADSAIFKVRARSISTPAITDESANLVIQDAGHTVNFQYTYNATTEILDVSMWIDKNSVIQTDAALLGAALASIYNGAALVTTLNDATPDANGEYSMTYDNSGGALVTGLIYNVTATITFNSSARSTGHTLSITIPAQLSVATSSVSAVQSSVSTVEFNQADIEAKVDIVDDEVDTLVTDAAAIKNAVGADQAQTAYEQVQQLESKTGDEADAAAAASLFGRMKDIREKMLGGGNANVTTHRLLARKATVKSGNTVTIQFKAPTGSSPTLDLYDEANLQRVTLGSMIELGVTGIFEYALTVNSGWGTGDFLVVALEGSNMDSMTLSVMTTDLVTIDANLDQVLLDTAQIKQDTGDMIAERGTINGGTPTTTSFISNLGSSVDDFYNGMVLVFTSGTSSGQVRKILDYIGSTKTVTLAAPLRAAPADTNTFTIFARQGQSAGDFVPDMAAISNAVWASSSRRLSDGKLDSGSLATLADLKKSEAAVKIKLDAAEAASGGGVTQFAQSAADKSKKVYSEILALKAMLDEGSEGGGSGGLATQMEELRTSMQEIRSSIGTLSGEVTTKDEKGVVSVQQVHLAIMELMGSVRDVSDGEGVDLQAIYDDIAKQGQSQQEIQNMVSATEAVAASIQEMMEKSQDKPVMTTWFETAVANA